MAEGTCYLPNGKVVAGGQASCQANGGTWVASGTEAPVKDDRGRLQKIGGWIAENPIEAASYGLIGAGPLGWGAKGLYAGGKALLSGKLKGRIGNFIDKKYRRDVISQNPNVLNQPKPPPAMDWNKPNTIGLVDRFGRTIPSRKVPPFSPYTGPALSKYGLPKPSVTGREYNRLRVAGTAAPVAGIAGLGIAGMAGSDERKAALKANIEQNILNAQKDVDAKQKVIDDAQKEKDRVAGLSDWERTFEKMKDPEYWRESMSGLPHDTRLMRLAQLMDYYGKTPKQRAAVDSPSENWAQMESDVQTNQANLAKAQATLMGKSPYGKPTPSNISDSIFEMVKTRYGDSWMPFDEKSDDELEKISMAISIKYTELVNANPLADRAQLMEQAFTAVESEQDL